MEEDSNSNEPSTSTGRSSMCDILTSAGCSTATMEADSGSQLPANLQTHPQDKSVLDSIDKFHTRRATQWALFSWNTWRLQKAREDGSHPAIPLFFEICGKPVEVMDKTLSDFVSECKNKGNEDYTPETLRGILFGLQRFLKAYCTIMDKKPMAFIKNEYQFPKYCQALKKKIDDLNEGGIVRKNAQAVGITPQEEEYLWDIGIFGCNSAEILSNTVFFYVVKIFGIVSSNALRTIKPDAFKFRENDTGKYVELDTNFASELDIYDKTSCCHNLSLLAPNTATKLRHYCNESNPRTFYNILKYYVETIKFIDNVENAFFLKPKKDMVFSNQAIGRLQLQRKFCKMMNSANLKGYFTTQALVQSCLDNLQVRGYMVRRKQSFLPQQQLEISKLLDPPPGIIRTADVKIQTKAILQLVDASRRLPVNQSHLQYVIQVNQSPQAGDPLSVLQNQTDLQNALHASQNFLQSGLHQSSTAAYVSTISNLTNQLTAANENMPQAAEGESVAVTDVNKSQVKSCQTKSDSVLPKNIFPIFMSKAENKREEKPLHDTENDSEGTNDYEFDNIIIKQEPADYEGEHFQISEARGLKKSSLNANQNEKSLKRKQDKNYQTNDESPKKSAKNYTGSVKCKNNEEYDKKWKKSDSKEEKLLPGEDNVTCTAEIEYSFKNDLNKEVTKQEISLKEDGQTMFNFSGTSKIGRQMCDLDINLGDYLPENCTIRPQDIDIKRVILPDGGKMMINLKYTFDK